MAVANAENFKIEDIIMEKANSDFLSNLHIPTKSSTQVRRN